MTFDRLMANRTVRRSVALTGDTALPDKLRAMGFPVDNVSQQFRIDNHGTGTSALRSAADPPETQPRALPPMDQGERGEDVL